MIQELINYFKDKKILILGFGKEGKSTYNLIRKYLKNQIIYIADENVSMQNDENTYYISGKNYLDNLEQYDIIMKSPGISFVGIDTNKYISKIKSQLELLLEFFDNYTIGVTGTKGKSTTSSLIYKILEEQNKDCMLLGNIGIPVFDFIDKIQKDTILVLEMSSHQLEYMELSPNIAIFLNIYEEHLDHYESFEKYAQAKANIFKYQKENDFLLFNSDSTVINSLIQNVKSKFYKVSLTDNGDICIKNNYVYMGREIYDIRNKRNLVGNYNLNNIMFALGVSNILNLNMDKTKETIANFKTLEHRLEFVGEFEGISYYDNSIATVPVATIEAVNTLEKVNTLIIGGMDRKIDYTEFIDFLNNSDIENIICMPKTGHDIAKHLKKEKAYIVETMEEAVEIAKKHTKKGEKCLLSPAAASYGFFKNFEEKGNLYKKLVK